MSLLTATGVTNMATIYRVQGVTDHSMQGYLGKILGGGNRRKDESPQWPKALTAGGVPITQRAQKFIKHNFTPEFFESHLRNTSGDLTMLYTHTCKSNQLTVSLSKVIFNEVTLIT